MEVVDSLRRVAVDVRGGVVENCGHWMPEEQPAELLRQLLAFFA
jgi:pimeloyl-ACP methyl ester carboxylesterase